MLGLGAALLGLGRLGFAWGAWIQADWAWLLGLGLAVRGAALALAGVLAGVVDMAAPMTTLLPVLLGAYLLLPGTRRAFGLLTAAESSHVE